MNLRDWHSNSQEFEKQLNETDCSDGDSIKILGLIWQKGRNVLNIHLDNTSPESNTLVNKRQILQRLAKNYDPLGLLSPAILLGKLLVQNLWHQQYKWNQPVPTEINLSWNRLLEDWNKTKEIESPRLIRDKEDKEEWQLHVNASSLAYAAAAYIRFESYTAIADYSNTIHPHISSSLIFSKNRLSPIKGMTVPRLELMALLIGVRVAKYLIDRLGIPFKKRII